MILNSLKLHFQNMSRVDLSNDRFEMTSEGTLKISHVNINDSAKYVCKAENKYGEPVVASAFVMVRAKTRVVKAPEHALFYQGNIEEKCLRNGSQLLFCITIIILATFLTDVKKLIDYIHFICDRCIIYI